jgi:hypothetical protein
MGGIGVGHNDFSASPGGSGGRQRQRERRQRQDGECDTMLQHEESPQVLRISKIHPGCRIRRASSFVLCMHGGGMDVNDGFRIFL